MDRYSNLIEIGRGTYGTVYSGFRHNEEVAIKVLERSDYREIDALFRIHSPYILHGRDLFLTEDNQLAIELPLAKRSLSKYKGPMDRREKAAAEITFGLLHLHEDGMYHYDVKPGNTLDFGDHCVICDFGLSEYIAPRFISTSKFTEGYAPPEFDRDEEVPMSDKADVYALGVTLKKLLKGQRPELVERMLCRPRPKLDEVAKEFSHLVQPSLRIVDVPEEPQYDRAVRFLKEIRKDRRARPIELCALIASLLSRSDAPLSVCSRVAQRLLYNDTIHRICDSQSGDRIAAHQLCIDLGGVLYPDNFFTEAKDDEDLSRQLAMVLAGKRPIHGVGRCSHSSKFTSIQSL